MEESFVGMSLSGLLSIADLHSLGYAVTALRLVLAAVSPWPQQSVLRGW
jgi:hypothetical protein